MLRQTIKLINQLTSKRICRRHNLATIGYDVQHILALQTIKNTPSSIEDRACDCSSHCNVQGKPVFFSFCLSSSVLHFKRFCRRSTALKELRRCTSEDNVEARLVEIRVPGDGFDFCFLFKLQG